MRSATRGAFTLIELLIVVVILGILAAVVIPQFADGSEDAKLARLRADLKSVRTAFDYYALQHGGHTPAHDHKGNIDKDGDNFVSRLISRTDASGKVSKTGRFGPYLNAFPTNPFVEDAANAAKVEMATGTPSGKTTGWSLNVTTMTFSANSAAHIGL